MQQGQKAIFHLEGKVSDFHELSCASLGLAANIVKVLQSSTLFYVQHAEGNLLFKSGP